MSSEDIMEAVKAGRADARSGLPYDPYYCADIDDCSAVASAYRRGYTAEARRIESSQQELVA